MLTKIHKKPATDLSQIPATATSTATVSGAAAPRRSRAIEKLAETYGVDGKQSPGKGELRRSPRSGLPSRFDICHVNWKGHRDDHGSDNQQAARLAHRKAAMVDFRLAIGTSFSEHTKQLGIEPTEVEGLVDQVCGSLKGVVPVETVKNLVGLEWDKFGGGKPKLLRVLGLSAASRSSDADSAADSGSWSFATLGSRARAASTVSGTSLSASPFSTLSRSDSVSGLQGVDDSLSILRIHELSSPHASEPRGTAASLAEPTAQARATPAAATPSAKTLSATTPSATTPVVATAVDALSPREVAPPLGEPGVGKPALLASKARSVPLPSLPLPPLPQAGRAQPSAVRVGSLEKPGTAVPVPQPPQSPRPPERTTRPRMPLPPLPALAPSKGSVASASFLPPLPLPPAPVAAAVTPEPRKVAGDTTPPVASSLALGTQPRTIRRSLAPALESDSPPEQVLLGRGSERAYGEGVRKAVAALYQAGKHS